MCTIWNIFINWKIVSNFVWLLMLNDSKLNLSILINIHLDNVFWSFVVYVVILVFVRDTFDWIFEYSI